MTALSVWTSKGDDKQGRIRGPWCTRRTLDVHLTPGIRAPRNPDSLTLSGGPVRLAASRGPPTSDPCSVCGALWRPHRGTPHTLQMTRWAGKQAPAWGGDRVPLIWASPIITFHALALKVSKAHSD